MALTLAIAGSVPRIQWLISPHRWLYPFAIFKVRGISDSYKEAVKLYTLDDKKFSSKFLNDETKKLLTGEFFLSIFNETFTNINDFEVQERKIIKRARHTINNYYKNNKFISNLYKNKAIILIERIGY